MKAADPETDSHYLEMLGEGKREGWETRVEEKRKQRSAKAGYRRRKHLETKAKNRIGRQEWPIIRNAVKRLLKHEVYKSASIY